MASKCTPGAGSARSQQGSEMEPPGAFVAEVVHAAARHVLVFVNSVTDALKYQRCVLVKVPVRPEPDDSAVDPPIAAVNQAGQFKCQRIRCP